MVDIEELDDTAQRLRVSWRKANNYYASFAREMLEVKQAIDSGAYGPEWTFSKWMLKKAGLFENQVMAQLHIFSRVIASENRDKIEAEHRRAIAEKKAAAEREAAARRTAAAEKRAAAAERRAAKEHQKRQKAAFLAEQRANAAAAEQAAQDAKKHRGAKAREEQRNKERREYKRRWDQERKQQAMAVAVPATSDNAELARLLDECRTIEKTSSAQQAAVAKTSRVDLGRRYAAMKLIVETQQAGKDANGKHWTWIKWAKFHIQKSRADINKCIVEFGASCAISHDENVVVFPQNIAGNQSLAG